MSNFCPFFKWIWILQSTSLSRIKQTEERINASNKKRREKETEIHWNLATFSWFVPDLKNKLLAFVERETLGDYDREAEAALQRIANGEVDINKLSNLWAKSYTEVRAMPTVNA